MCSEVLAAWNDMEANNRYSNVKYVPKSQCIQTYNPVCGNGVIEIGEECDQGQNGGSCCTAQCTFTAGSECQAGECCSNCKFKLPTRCGPVNKPGYCANGKCETSVCDRFSGWSFCDVETSKCQQKCQVSSTSCRNLNGYTSNGQPIDDSIAVGTVCNSNGGKCNSNKQCVTAPTPASVGTWSTGQWSTCSQACGEGTQTRSVTCPAATCSGTKPPSTQTCKIADCPSYAWKEGAWSTCTQVCDGGIQSRSVSCFRDGTTAVADSFCSGSKPTSSQSCGTAACPRAWKEGTWSPCSVICGGGTRTRTVVCQKTVGTAISTVQDSECSGVKPATTQTCGTDPCPTFSWSQSGVWSECSKPCGGGTQTRTVNCIDSSTGQKTDDTKCTGTKPNTSQACNTEACPIYAWQTTKWTPLTCPTECGKSGISQSRTVTCYETVSNTAATETYCTSTKPPVSVTCPDTPACPTYSWKVGPYSSCSSTKCGESGTRKRPVTCQSSNTETVADSYCTGTKPVDVESCVGACSSLDKEWRTSVWLPCDAQCGSGQATRNVTCVLKATGEEATGCAGTQPSATGVCNAHPCPKWVVSEWSKCDAKCGQGNQNRTVQCKDAFGSIAANDLCANQNIPISTQLCNSEPCPHWHREVFTYCNKPCGGGQMFRNLTCRMPHDGYYLGRMLKDPALCQGQDVPPTTVECNTLPCPKHYWSPDQSGWSSCDKPCGGGVQNARIVCLEFDGNSNKVVADSFCTSDKPATSRPCNVQDCPSPSWKADNWTECSQQCGGGVRSRVVSCLDGVAYKGKFMYNVLDKSMCKSAMPAESEPCNEGSAMCNGGTCYDGVCRCPDLRQGLDCTKPAAISQVTFEQSTTGDVIPRDKTVLRWQSTGSLPFVHILMVHDVTKKSTYVQRDYPNTKIFSWEVPTNMPAGSYRILVRYSDKILATSSTFVLADSCKFTNCGANGSCKLGECQCLNGYSGSTCSISPCAAKGCNPIGSTCSVSNGQASCVCKQGWTGEYCMANLQNSCQALVCKNNNRPAVGNPCSSQCECSAWFTGTLCGSCRGVCLHGGVMASDCSKCTCKAGYAGDMCNCPFAKFRAQLVLGSTDPAYSCEEASRLYMDDLRAALTISEDLGMILLDSCSKASATVFDVTVRVSAQCDRTSMANVNFKFPERMARQDTPGSTGPTLTQITNDEIVSLLEDLKNQMQDPASRLRRGLMSGKLSATTIATTNPPNYVDPCAGRVGQNGLPCSGRGVCNTKTNGVCKCDAGFVGDNCDDPLWCYGKDCSGHGKCVDKGCVCDQGWEGSSCQIPTSLCKDLSCSGQGTCNSGVCTCSAGYSGRNCEIAPDACLKVNCNGHGSCLSGKCICTSPWSGLNCQTNQDDVCKTSACGKHGTYSNGFCTCQDSWSGEFCQIPPPTCNDGFKNGGETGVDCGGPCGACPTCSDGIKNRDEIGVDCGGTKCEKCETCGDGIKNNGETGIDCGGPNCASCNATATCNDKTKNGKEIGIDCGGSCPPCLDYHWSVSSWSACSRVCGGGKQFRRKECQDENGIAVDDLNCAQLHGQPTARSCNEQNCSSYKWQIGKEDQCSSDCSEGFKQREVYCVDVLWGNTRVVDGYCNPICKPLSKVVCNEGKADCGKWEWKVSEWGECDKACGGGFQTRSVGCVDTTTKLTVSASLCPGSYPLTTKQCNTDPCVQHRWKLCGWDECTAVCGGGSNGGKGGASMLGVRSRSIVCEDTLGNHAHHSKCANLQKPDTEERSCNEHECQSANWMTSKWSGCVITADNSTKGKRTRSYHCHYKDGGQATNDVCSEDAGAGPHPHTEEDCDIRFCPLQKTSPPTESIVSSSPKLTTSNFIGVGLFLGLCFLY